MLGLYLHVKKLKVKVTNNIYLICQKTIPNE